MLKHCPDDVIEVSPSVLAKVADMIDFDINVILESLDEFIFQGDAEAVLDE
ncbi:hypothetical protein [Pontiella sulfatireligans]|uniref:hypothetical protein n=1 Tax=Pontiella sulfatireligans TaxID=2750658 RepID=UPI00144435E2|nr:hypothetical protein [Pontiella sulfatireligans]